MIKSLLLSAILVACAGCGSTVPADPSKMTAEQLTAFAKDKNANISCAVINSPYGRGVATYVVLDKTVIVSGTVSVDTECKVVITSAPATISTPVK